MHASTPRTLIAFLSITRLTPPHPSILRASRPSDHDKWHDIPVDGAPPKGRIAFKFKIPQRADTPDNVTPTWINLAPMSAPGRTSDCIHTNVTPSRLLGRQLGVPRTELVYVCTQCAPQHNCRTAHPAFIVTAPPIRLRQQHYYIPLDAHTLRHAPPTRPGGHQV